MCSLLDCLMAWRSHNSLIADDDQVQVFILLFCFCVFLFVIAFDLFSGNTFGCVSLCQFALAHIGLRWLMSPSDNRISLCYSMAVFSENIFGLLLIMYDYKTPATIEPQLPTRNFYLIDHWKYNKLVSSFNFDFLKNIHFNQIIKKSAGFGTCLPIPVTVLLMQSYTLERPIWDKIASLIACEGHGSILFFYTKLLPCFLSSSFLKMSII